MMKFFPAVFFFLLLFSDVTHAGNPDKYKQSDKAKEKYMKKLEKKIKKQQAAFYKKQHKAEIRKGKHANGIGNNYENTVK